MDQSLSLVHFSEVSPDPDYPNGDGQLRTNLHWGGQCVNYENYVGTLRELDDINYAGEVALVLTVALKLGVIPPSDYMYSTLKTRALKLTRSLAYYHGGRQPGNWNDQNYWGFMRDRYYSRYPTNCNANWMTGRPSSYAGLAAWLFWDLSETDFSTVDREYVRLMIEYEANRLVDTTAFYHVANSVQPILPNVGYRYDKNGTPNVRTSTATPVPGTPADNDPYGYTMTGDTKAEENAWKARIAQLAAAMMPDHPNFDNWWSGGLDLTMSAFSRHYDVSSTEVLHGKQVRAWLNGSNASNPEWSQQYIYTMDGLIVNGHKYNPNYAAAIIHIAQGGLVNALSGRTAPKGAFFNADQVYDTWVRLNFPATTQSCYDGNGQPNIWWIVRDLINPTPCFNAPGGPIYTTNPPAGRPVYYPMGDLPTVQDNPARDILLKDIMSESPSDIVPSNWGIFALSDAYAQAFEFGYNDEQGWDNDPDGWESFHTDSSRFFPSQANVAEGYLVKWLQNQSYFPSNQGTKIIPRSDLPPRWRDSDVGTVSRAGIASFAPTLDPGNPGTFTVKGWGPYPGEAEERAHFTYETMRGNGEIVARKTSWSAPGGSIAQAGIMIREKLTSGSRMVRVLFQGNVGNGIQPYFKWRATEDGSAGYTFGPGYVSDQIKLVRSGNTFTGYAWVTGEWKTISSITISMSSEVYIGLAASSSDASTELSTSFDNVTTWLIDGTDTYGTPPPPPPDEQRPIVDNDPWTHWASSDTSGGTSWVRLDFPNIKSVNSVSVEWFLGYQRSYTFKIQAWHTTGLYWYDVDPARPFWYSSGTLSSEEKYYFTSINTSKIRIVGYGFTGQGVPSGPWTSIRELKVYGTTAAADSDKP